MTWWFTGKRQAGQYLRRYHGVYEHTPNGPLSVFSCHDGRKVLLRPMDMLDALDNFYEMRSCSLTAAGELRRLQAERTIICEGMSKLPAKHRQLIEQEQLRRLQPQLEDPSPAVVSAASEVINRFTLHKVRRP